MALEYARTITKVNTRDNNAIFIMEPKMKRFMLGKVSNSEKLETPSLSLKMGALYILEPENLNFLDLILVGYP